MSKKLIGDRSIGDFDFVKDQVISDEEFAASGLEASDVVEVSEEATAAPVEEATPVAPADEAAEIDAQAPGEKNEQEQSAPASSDAGDQGGASAIEGATDETVEHTLTEQDFIDHPELTEEGHNVGDVVRVPKPTSTEEAPAA